MTKSTHQQKWYQQEMVLLTIIENLKPNFQALFNKNKIQVKNEARLGQFLSSYSYPILKLNNLSEFLVPGTNKTSSCSILTQPGRLIFLFTS